MILNRIKKASIDLLPDGTHADGGNLYLRKKGSARSWVFRYRFHYKTFELGIGSAWTISIADARKKAGELRVQVANGECPSVHIRKIRTQKALVATQALADQLTLSQIVAPALRRKMEVKELRTKRYLPRELNTFLKYAAPTIGNIPMSEITLQDIASVLRPIAKKGAGVSVLSTLRACYSYAAAEKNYTGPNPTAWKGGLDMLLPRLDPRDACEHLYSLDWREIPALYQKISEQKQTPVVRTIQILMLAPFRVGEVLGALSANLDAQAGTITLNTTKTSKKPVVVPLSRQAVELMQSDGEVYVIERSTRSQSKSTTPKPLYPAIVLGTLRKISGNPAMTLHGFRSSFSTWCAENGKDPATRERCLGHAVDTKVALAYQRSDLLDQRRALLQEWADYAEGQCTAGECGEITLDALCCFQNIVP